MCEVSHRSVKRFCRRFFYDFIFNPIWPPDHVTDVVNLILHSRQLVDQIYEVSDLSDKDYGWNKLHGESPLCLKFHIDRTSGCREKNTL